MERSHDGRIVIAATFTAEPVASGLCFLLDEVGLNLDVSFSPYNQVFQELLSPTSLLATNASGVNVVLVRVEDFVREIADVDAARLLIEKTVRDLCDALTRHGHRGKVPTLLALFPPSPFASPALKDDIKAANSDLMGHAGPLPGVTLLSSDEIARVSTGEIHDSLGDRLAHMPFTEEHYASLALAIVRKVHALRIPAQKVLVLDCDETLWRGVVGEDGVEGITIPPALACVQQFAVNLQAQGVLVCLASKNAERDVLEVFQKRSDMVLKEEHIVGHRINWEPKPRNVASLARAFNLGLDSLVFIDDNPVECALMRAELPQVVTLQLPPDEDIPSFLSSLWAFDKIATTDEDTRRTIMYREDAARHAFEESTTDIAAFIASLALTIDIAPPESSDWPRLAQLTQRTNQFNFTTVRRNEVEMRALPSRGDDVLSVKVRDRFGDYGLVGLVVARAEADALVVDTLLLSCRVLGRGVEHTILRRLGDRANERNVSFVELPYLPTPKNEPARAFAESVAPDFRAEQNAGIVYRIPVGYASTISHRPGHDPAAVMQALRSEEAKTDAPTSKVSATVASRSELHARLARELTSGPHLLRAERARRARRRTLPGSPSKPATEIERRMTALWQDLLLIEGLGVDDDYFGLGGTSVVAARLFAEIERHFGVRLRLTEILDAPTVRTLSRRIESEQIVDRRSLVDLKRGGRRHLFLVHDGDGETLLYLNLARRLPSDVAVIGIEPRRISGVPLAQARIEDMAAFYIGEIRARQPRGPYLLGGMCAGAVIACEIANQLAGSGESTELLIVLDAAVPGTARRTGRIARQRLNRLSDALAQAKGQEHSSLGRVFVLVRVLSQRMLSLVKWEVLARSKRFSVRVRFRLLKRLLTNRRSWPPFIPALSVREIYDSAETWYLPKRLPGTSVVLLRATVGQGDDTPYRDIYEDGRLGWAGVADDLTVIDVDGGHSSMLQEPFVASLAAALTARLDEKSATVRKQQLPDMAAL